MYHAGDRLQVFFTITLKPHVKQCTGVRCAAGETGQGLKVNEGRCQRQLLIKDRDQYELVVNRWKSA